MKLYFYKALNFLILTTSYKQANPSRMKVDWGKQFIFNKNKFSLGLPQTGLHPQTIR